MEAAAVFFRCHIALARLQAVQLRVCDVCQAVVLGTPLLRPRSTGVITHFYPCATAGRRGGRQISTGNVFCAAAGGRRCTRHMFT